MRTRGHAKLLVAATVVWAVFFVAGLPDYYRQYSPAAMVALCVALLVPFGAVGYLALRPVPGRARMRRAVALAFWFTVPLALYDYAWCGIHLGHGLGFLGTYWYLTIYYVFPWLLLPSTAAWLDRAGPPGAAATHPGAPDRLAQGTPER